MMQFLIAGEKEVEEVKLEKEERERIHLDEKCRTAILVEEKGSSFFVIVCFLAHCAQSMLVFLKKNYFRFLTRAKI